MYIQIWTTSGPAHAFLMFNDDWSREMDTVVLHYVNLNLVFACVEVFRI